MGGAPGVIVHKLYLFVKLMAFHNADMYLPNELFEFYLQYAKTGAFITTEYQMAIQIRVNMKNVN